MTIYTSPLYLSYSSKKTVEFFFPVINHNAINTLVTNIYPLIHYFFSCIIHIEKVSCKSDIFFISPSKFYISAKKFLSIYVFLNFVFFLLALGNLTNLQVLDHPGPLTVSQALFTKN